MRIGVFGGTFNPVHYGHLRAAEEAAEALGLQRVLFVPAGSPPLKSKGLASAEARLRMVEMAIAGNPLFELSSIEAAKPGKSFSVDTLSELSRERGELVFILGIDAFRDIHLWHETEKLVKMADFAVLTRPGYPIDLTADMPYAEISPEGAASLALGQAKVVTGRLKGGRRLDILPITPMGVSATEIRARISEGRSVRYLLPESVESFIMSNGLYKGQAG